MKRIITIIGLAALPAAGIWLRCTGGCCGTTRGSAGSALILFGVLGIVAANRSRKS